MLCTGPQDETLITSRWYPGRSSPLQSPQATAAERVARGETDARRFAGISWHVEQRDRILERGSVGHADHALSQPLQDDAIFRIYSMTKPVVSLLACLLIDEGKLALDTPVSHFFKKFGHQGVLLANGKWVALERQATLEDLLTHRAGLSYDFIPGCPVGALYREACFFANGSRSLEDLAKELSDLPLARQPGSAWYYSYGTDLVAAIVQAVLDKPLGECLRTRVFNPLGMKETGYGVDPAQEHRLAGMFGARDLDVEFIDGSEPQRLLAMHVDASYPSNQPDTFARGGLGLFSTLYDYARFARFLIDGLSADGEQLISSAMLDDMWQNRLPAEQRPICIADRAFPGYGWGLLGRVMVDTEQAGVTAPPGEGGWSGAASTWFWVDRKRRFSGVVLTQYLGAQVHLGELIQTAAYSDHVVL